MNRRDRLGGSSTLVRLLGTTRRFAAEGLAGHSGARLVQRTGNLVVADHVADGAGLDSLLVAQRVVKEGALGVFALDQHTSRLLAAEADGAINDIQGVHRGGKETGEE